MHRFTTIVALVALAFGFTVESQAAHKVRFKVRYENITSGEILKSSTGKTAPLAVAPGLWLVGTIDAPLFRTGEKDWGHGLESLAEDGDPTKQAEFCKKHKGIVGVGVYNTPVGASMPGPITPGNAFEFTFEASSGQRLFLANMWGQSNDLFFGTNELGIPLFDAKDTPLSGDITNRLFLYDAGTEVNEEPGFGPNQGPRQSGPNTGVDENGVVRPVLDQWHYPTVVSTIRVTVTPAQGDMMGMTK